jgi:hypothetical protein
LIGQARGSIADTVQGRLTELRQEQRAIEGLNNVTPTATENINKLIEALDQVPSQSSGNGRASGGPIFRAGGGGIGTDVVPAMLSPNEFVMNARAARKFHSQLVAMNAGMNPTIYRQGGGDVTTNISLGDVVVNEARGPVNPRHIADGIERELRKGTIR